ncbi:hypothetical protein BT93_L1963 [Corymbia citriodora subsp. variegata]|uniref:Uncharacterized protein n=1 Tax=Corymbia citriodora subsp. variegata TaxID=360336 RepID=A0A8T0CL87_CORYI|nr:hypothetical protein BT93_L1963 [Corymbia citriodora subsp. variegata]
MQMASFSAKSNSKYNARSISFPSRTHPTTRRIDAELNKLKSLEAKYQTPSSGSVLAGLSGLEELYISLDDLLSMPSTRQALSCIQGRSCTDGLLEGSVRLLDVCGSLREMLMLIKEHVQALQSVLRRRKGDSSIEAVISDYAGYRKRMRKDAKRLMRIMGTSSLGASTLIVDDLQLSSLARVLSEVDAVSTSVFQSIVSFLAVPLLRSKQSKWSLVSRLVHRGAVACEDTNQEDANEFECVDASLFALCKHGANDGVDSEKLQSTQHQLGALEMSIGDIENAMEGLYRRLIRTRASLLNIISQ